MLTQNFADFSVNIDRFIKFKKTAFFHGKIVNFIVYFNLWGHVSCHKKIGPDKFSCFDLCWIHSDIRYLISGFKKIYSKSEIYEYIVRVHEMSS